MKKKECNSVADWVEYIQTLHFREIDMSLGRVSKVLTDLTDGDLGYNVITVAGTNGKGSVAELTSSILHASGLRVGKFSSPHLVKFNERIVINGEQISDAVLLDSFKRIEATRADTGITYFEYCFLLAVDCFRTAGVDVAVMEVGLGGRFDAVNALDADISLITSISLDHTDWLGSTVEEIGFEKAGVARNEKPCILGLREPQESILNHLAAIGSIKRQIGLDFDFSEKKNSFSFHSDSVDFLSLPLPFRQSGVQLINACLAIQAAIELKKIVDIPVLEVQSGIANASIGGRCQILHEAPLVILDVAHNEDSIRSLVSFIKRLKVAGKVYALCGMLKDKQIGVCLELMRPVVDAWNFVSIDNTRGASAKELAAIYDSLNPEFEQTSHAIMATAREAYDSVRAKLNKDDCLVVFGSFFVAGDILNDESFDP